MKQQFIVSVPARRKWSDATKAFDDLAPAFQARVEIDVDLGSVAEVLGRKAARAAGKRSVAMGGKIKVKYLGAA